MLKGTVMDRKGYISDGELRFEESFTNFVDRVIEEANKHWSDGHCKADVQFVGNDRAVIIWKEE